MMAAEIERKFLVCGSDWRRGAQGVVYRQGYLNTEKERTVRVRTVGSRAFLTVKGLTQGITRAEFEYEIPYDDAVQMLAILAQRPLIEKCRYTLAYAGNVWEIDEFLGENAGLVVAEIELAHADAEFAAPPWLGAEVSSDPRYFNNNLVLHPYTRWCDGVSGSLNVDGTLSPEGK